MYMYAVCEITFVVQGDTLLEGFKICMEMCRQYVINYVFLNNFTVAFAKIYQDIFSIQLP